MVIISNLIVMHLLYYLLEPKLLKAIQGNKTGVALAEAASVLMCEGKTDTGNNFLQLKGNIYTGILVLCFVPLGLWMTETS